MEINIFIFRRRRQLLSIVSLNFHWLKLSKESEKTYLKNDLKEENRCASNKRKHIDFFGR